MTKDDLARSVFGQSLAAERWAVACNETAWRARRSRLQAFESTAAGYTDAAKTHMQDAAHHERNYAELVRNGVNVFRRQEDAESVDP